jgi:acyl-CoA thioesterase-1
MGWHVRIRAAALVALAAISCGSDENPVGPDESRSTPVVVAFGDSLTSGPGIEPSETYPALLQQRINKLGLRYDIVNAGVSGDTSTEALARIDKALVPEAQIMILALGINDGLRGIPIPAIERNLAAMIERAKARDVDVLLCGMEAPPTRGFAYMIEFHRMFTRLAERYQLALVPFFLIGVAGAPDLNLPDRIHPNAAGHKRIAEEIWRYLEPML